MKKVCSQSTGLWNDRGSVPRCIGNKWIDEDSFIVMSPCVIPFLKQTHFISVVECLFFLINILQET